MGDRYQGDRNGWADDRGGVARGEWRGSQPQGDRRGGNEYNQGYSGGYNNRNNYNQDYYHDVNGNGSSGGNNSGRQLNSRFQNEQFPVRPHSTLGPNRLSNWPRNGSCC
eukprot:gnl/Chilomastix_caulleri/3316.p2 GENE.gnl/Chilomastix_caulleri/3316~~gnl/Chilomastix_caulleri/3316.p2  ORF type:complete len:109 (+),score=26.55 gnl/Chilomastix_caulleri/3316:500-826(+)